MFIAGAIIGAGVLGAGASIIGANKQAGAAKDAASLQMSQYDKTNALNRPFVDAGYGATTRLSDLLGTSGNTGASGYGDLTRSFTGADYTANADPGYAFMLQQGNQALQNSQAAGSGVMSGAALKDLLSYNQEYAKTGYNDAFNRYQTQQGNIFSRLSSLSQMGQASASNTAAAGTALAGNAGQAISNAGTASGAGIVGAGNALSGAGTNYWLSNLLQKPPPVAGTV